jgi:hypothetical protein
MVINNVKIMAKMAKRNGVKMALENESNENQLMA